MPDCVHGILIDVLLLLDEIMKHLLILLFLFSMPAFSQLSLLDEPSEIEYASEEQAPAAVHEEKFLVQDVPQADSIERVKITDEKAWSVSVGLGLGNVTSPSSLDSESSAGLAWLVAGSYAWRHHFPLQWELRHNDFGDTVFGVTSLSVQQFFYVPTDSLYDPFFGFGLSFYNANSSATYTDDYAQFGLLTSLGVAREIEQTGHSISVRADLGQIFSKSEAKEVKMMSFILSYTIPFSLEQWANSVKLLNHLNP